MASLDSPATIRGKNTCRLAVTPVSKLAPPFKPVPASLACRSLPSNWKRRGCRNNRIQFALERLLVDPDFLLRVHRDPKPLALSPQPYRLSDLDLASRLSFFLWSSIPDDRLLSLAERGQLSNTATMEKEVRRMVADPRATEALVDNFAAQWLNLRRVEEVVVDPDRYPNYDES